MKKEDVDKIIEMLDSRDTDQIALARLMLEQALPTLSKFSPEMMTGHKDWLVITVFQDHKELWCVAKNQIWFADTKLNNQPLLYMEKKPYTNQSNSLEIYPAIETDASGAWVKNPTRTANVTMRSVHPEPPLQSHKFVILDFSEDNITKI